MAIHKVDIYGIVSIVQSLSKSSFCWNCFQIIVVLFFLQAVQVKFICWFL